MDNVSLVLSSTLAASVLLTCLSFQQLLVTPIQRSLHPKLKDPRPLLIYRLIIFLFATSETIYMILCFIEYQNEESLKNDIQSGNTTEEDLLSVSSTIITFRIIFEMCRYLFLSITLVLFAMDTLETQYEMHIDSQLPHWTRVIFVTQVILFNFTLIGACAASLYTQSSKYWAMQMIHLKFDILLGCTLSIFALFSIFYQFSKRIKQYMLRLEVEQQQIQQNKKLLFMKNMDLRNKAWHAKCKLFSMICLLFIIVIAEGVYIPYSIIRVTDNRDIRYPPWETYSSPLEFILQRILFNVILVTFVHWMFDNCLWMLLQYICCQHCLLKQHSIRRTIKGSKYSENAYMSPQKQRRIMNKKVEKARAKLNHSLIVYCLNGGLIKLVCDEFFSNCITVLNDCGCICCLFCIKKEAIELEPIFILHNGTKVYSRRNSVCGGGQMVYSYNENGSVAHLRRNSAQYIVQNKNGSQMFKNNGFHHEMYDVVEENDDIELGVLDDQIVNNAVFSHEKTRSILGAIPILGVGIQVEESLSIRDDFYADSDEYPNDIEDDDSHVDLRVPQKIIEDDDDEDYTYLTPNVNIPSNEMIYNNHRYSHGNNSPISELERISMDSPFVDAQLKTRKRGLSLESAKSSKSNISNKSSISRNSKASTKSSKSSNSRKKIIFLAAVNGFRKGLKNITEKKARKATVEHIYSTDEHQHSQPSSSDSLLAGIQRHSVSVFENTSETKNENISISAVKKSLKSMLMKRKMAINENKSVTSQNVVVSQVKLEVHNLHDVVPASMRIDRRHSEITAMPIDLSDYRSSADMTVRSSAILTDDESNSNTDSGSKKDVLEMEEEDIESDDKQQGHEPFNSFSDSSNATVIINCLHLLPQESEGDSDSEFVTEL